MRNFRSGYDRPEIKNLSLHFFFFPVFLGLHLQHMEVPRLGLKLEL